MSVVILTKRNIAKAKPAPPPRGPPTDPTLEAVAPPAPPPTDADLVPDGSRDKLLKLIPGEAAVAYTTACGFSAESIYLPPVAFVLSSIVLFLTIWSSGKNHTPPVEPERMQYVVRFSAFVAWAFAIQNPLAHWTTISAWIPAVGVLFIPLIGSYVVGGSDPEPAPT